MASLEESKELEILREEMTCKVCISAKVEKVTLPCGHLITCERCVSKVRNCPLCRKIIRGTVQAGFPQTSAKSDPMLPNLTCNKCKKERVQTILLPCRHLDMCADCTEKTINCIRCGSQILGTDARSSRTYVKMRNYLDLLSEILTYGTVKRNRTGVTTRSLIGRTLRFDDIDDAFPLVTSKRVPFRMIFEETMFFLRGETQTKKLEEKGIKIWKGNTSREFLDASGLTYLEEGDMGKGYGHQIRNFGSTGCDQLLALITGLREDPWDRRHLITHWCPSELAAAALPPCHVMHTYSVEFSKDKYYLDSSFVMRSTDAFHGLPFNIASYALINALIANCCGFVPRSLVYFGHDVHAYETHLGLVEKQLDREPRPLPKLVVRKNMYRDIVDDTLKELQSLTFEDIELIGYDPHSPLKADMVV